MVFNAASAIVGYLRSRRARPHVRPGVYYLDGSNEWVYVPVSATVVRGMPGLDRPRDALDPHWRVRTVVVDASVNEDADAPVHFAVHDPEELHPAADLSVSEELLEKIARRAERALAAAA
jgi:hypothetical protein